MQDLDLDIRQRSHFTKTSAQTYEFYLSGEILEPSEYIEWFDVIRSAREDDTVKIYINSCGGNTDTAVQFMYILRNTPAYVICCVEGACMSAATIIFLQGNALEIAPHSMYLFHNYAGGAFGKGGELYDQINFERSWSRNLLEDVYQDFLTQTEIEQMLDNKDIWLDGEEVKKRAAALSKLHEARAQEIQICSVEDIQA